MRTTHQHDHRPAALYTRGSSDRQDVDLSVATQPRALKDDAGAEGYTAARKYVDEAESGRAADRPECGEVIMAIIPTTPHVQGIPVARHRWSRHHRGAA